MWNIFSLLFTEKVSAKLVLFLLKYLDDFTDELEKTATLSFLLLSWISLIVTELFVLYTPWKNFGNLFISRGWTSNPRYFCDSPGFCWEFLMFPINICRIDSNFLPYSQSYCLRILPCIEKLLFIRVAGGFSINLLKIALILWIFLIFFFSIS